MKKSLVTSLLLTSSLFAGNVISPHTPSSAYPTMENLAIEWGFDGDDNRNASVSVAYRVMGADSWSSGMPLRYVVAGSTSGKSWGNRLAGSIFDLTADSEYEVKLNLTDPDGYDDEQILTVRTRAELSIPSGARIIDLPAGNHPEFEVENGTEASPVVYRNSAGGAVFGRINMYAAEWVILDGLTINNSSGVGVKMNGSKNCVVQNCTITAQYGIVAYSSGIENCVITDNTITGTTVWSEGAMGSSGNNIGEGIEFTGAGNIIRYNTVSGFRDCISTMEDSEARNQMCNDIHNNDIYGGADDGIEADFLMHNNRVYENRITNSFVGLSSQPGLGGPNYFVRNVMYNVVYAPYKFHRGSVGDVVMHNTVVKSGDGMTCRTDAPFDYAYFRNNLAVAGGPGGKWGGINCGEGRGARIYAVGPNCDFGYDAVASVNGQGNGKIGSQSFEEFEPTGIALGNIGSLDVIFSDVYFPSAPGSNYRAQDLRPHSSAPTIDKGEVIVGLNDGFSGSAPDIGAYEQGQELPHYGPRVDDGTAIGDGVAFKSGAKSLQMRVTGNSIQFNEITTGEFRIFNGRGQMVSQTSLVQSNSLNIPSFLSSGFYMGILEASDGVVHTASFIQ